MVLLDSGPLFAAIDAGDRYHAVCADHLRRLAAEVIVPCTVIEEAAYLVGKRLGERAEVELLKAVASGELQVEHVQGRDWQRAADLLTRYSDLRLGTVDASLVAVAERLSIEQILTLDRKHFAVVRPSHCDSFQLLPHG